MQIMQNTLKLNLAFLFIIVFLSSCNNDVPPTKEEDYKIVTIESDWYDVNYVEQKTYVIEEKISSQYNNSFLLIGNNRALMFDTGAGENEAVNGSKIKYIIDQLTDKPVSLLLSHFHFDHNQNVGEFDHIVFPDLPFLKEKIDENDIYKFSEEELFLTSFPKEVKVNEWFPLNSDIDLGDRTIQIVNIPGHTKESVAIIDKTNKLAFLGDYLYTGSLFIFNEADFKPYMESVNHLISILNDEYRLFGAHGKAEMPFSKLQQLKDFLICIDNNTCQSEEKKLWGYDVRVYTYEDMSFVLFL